MSRWLPPFRARPRPRARPDSSPALPPEDLPKLSVVPDPDAPPEDSPLPARKPAADRADHTAVRASDQGPADRKERADTGTSTTQEHSPVEAAASAPPAVEAAATEAAAIEAATIEAAAIEAAAIEAAAIEVPPTEGDTDVASPVRGQVATDGLEPVTAPIENITPIELLVELTRKGELDPWNLDLVAVADRYLAVLEQREELSLPLTGRMLLYACILLHLKAQELSRRYLEALPPAAAQPGEPGYEPLDLSDDGGDLDDSTPLAIVPGEGLVLLARPRRRRRKVTLDDLLKAIRSFEENCRRSKIEGVLPTDLISQAAHGDDVLTDIGLVREALGRLGRLSKISFWDLVPRGIRPASLFVALLHMAAGDEVNLRQDEFYGDLTVVRKAGAA